MSLSLIRDDNELCSTQRIYIRESFFVSIDYKLLLQVFHINPNENLSLVSPDNPSENLSLVSPERLQFSPDDEDRVG